MFVLGAVAKFTFVYMLNWSENLHWNPQIFVETNIFGNWSIVKFWDRLYTQKYRIFKENKNVKKLVEQEPAIRL